MGLDVLSIIAGVLKALNYFLDIVGTEQKMAAGENRAVVKAMAELEVRLGVSKDIEAEVAAMSREERIAAGEEFEK